MIDLTKLQKGFNQAITLTKFRENNPELFSSLHPKIKKYFEILEYNFSPELFEEFLKACKNISVCKDFLITENPKIYKKFVERKPCKNHVEKVNRFLEKLYLNVAFLKNSDTETIKKTWHAINVVSLIINLYNVIIIDKNKRWD